MSAAVLPRTLRAEWARLWSVRSTWLFVGAAGLGVTGISLLVGADARGDHQVEPGETVWIAVEILGMLAMLVLLALASVSTTSDYGTGGIVPTLQWTPRRGILLVARTTVVVVTVALLGVLLASWAAVLISRIAPVLGIPLDEGVDTLLALAFVYALGSRVAVGLGSLIRNAAGPVVAVLALMLVLPLILGNLPFDWAQDIAAILPGSSAVRLILGEGIAGLTVTEARATLAAWAVGAMLAGGWRLLRTDADR
jgi:ABC-2 type transport system permease protein